MTGPPEDYRRVGIVKTTRRQRRRLRGLRQRQVEVLRPPLHHKGMIVEFDLIDTVTHQRRVMPRPANVADFHNRAGTEFQAAG